MKFDDLFSEENLLIFNVTALLVLSALQLLFGHGWMVYAIAGFAVFALAGLAFYYHHLYEKNKKMARYLGGTALLILLLAILILGYAATSTSSGSHSLGFSIYENHSTLLPIYKVLYAGANSSDLLIDDAWTPLEEVYVSYWNTPKTFSRMIIANNVSELTSFTLEEANQFNFGKNDYVDYDSEAWALTPRTEQEGIVQYTQEACNDVHAAGYKFAFSPEIDAPGWYGLTQFSRINWTCVDFLDLQEQSNSGSTSTLITNVTALLAESKAKNPNLVVFVQLDQTAGSLAVLEADILAMSQISGVNGVIIQDLSTSESSNSTLTTLVNYTKGIAAS